MNAWAKMNTATSQAYQLEGLLRVMSKAIDGAPDGGTFAVQGGALAIAIDLAADMAGQIVEDLEASEQPGNSASISPDA